MKMNAAVLVSNRRIEMHRIDVPEPGPGEVLVRVAHSGVCGSDLSTFRGTHPYKRAPTVLGHEFAGTVMQSGEGAERFRPGDRVCAAAYSNCGVCSFCRKGQHNLCTAKIAPSAEGWLGSFAEFAIARANKLYHLPDRIGLVEGALVEPLSIGIHALRLAGDVRGRDMLIIGSGNIGLSCVFAARLLQAAKTVCLDTDGGKGVLTAACGATAFLSVGAESRAAATQPLRQSFDIVVVAAGYPRALLDAVEFTRNGGTVVVVSYFDDLTPLDVVALVRREIKLAGAALSTDDDFAQVIAALSEGAMVPESMVTHRFALRDAAAAMTLMDRPHGTVGKIVLDMPEGAPV
jgi:2-desacetyl-2-hydroxyethyl bacteriochlorophyllide A dehydrogenase